MTTVTPPARPPRVKEPKVTDRAVVKKLDDYLSTCVPDKHKVATERALKGMMSRTNAVKIKCLQCAGFQFSEVKNCTVITCALHPIRPYAQSSGDDE